MKYSMFTKTAAAILLCITLLITVLGTVFVIILGADNELYNSNPNYFSTYTVCELARRDAMTAGNYLYWNYIEYGADIHNLNDALNEADRNIRFKATHNGKTVYDGTDSKDVYGYTYTYEMTYSTDRAEEDLDITVYILKDLPENDIYGFTAQVYEFGAGNSTMLLLITLSAFIVSAALFVYLLCAAGHSKNGDIVTSGLNIIPADIYFFILIIGGIFFADLFVAAFSSFDVSYDIALPLLCAFAFYIAGYLLFLAFFLSLAARLKQKGWYKKSLVYFILHIIYRYILTPIGRIIISIPVIWKTVILIPLLIIAEVFITESAYNNYYFGWNVVWVLVQLAIVFLILLCAQNMSVLKKAGERLAKGELNYKINTKTLIGDFRKHGESLNSIGDGMKAALDEQMKSERLKTELITNVSHDIKTPVTSIINYTDLLQKEDIDNEKARSYIDVIERQSRRLKKLTSDIVEASKAASGNIVPVFAPLDLSELLAQALAEYSDRMEKAGLKTVVSIPDNPVMINADGRLMWRVFDNLLSNIVKYSCCGTRVYISLTAGQREAAVSFRNISAEPLNISTEELFGRFVRGDSSRSTEGSGLGLSIAQSLTELQGGKLNLTLDGDLFKATVLMGIIQTPVNTTPRGNGAVINNAGGTGNTAPGFSAADTESSDGRPDIVIQSAGEASGNEINREANIRYSIAPAQGDEAVSENPEYKDDSYTFANRQPADAESLTEEQSNNLNDHS